MTTLLPAGDRPALGPLVAVHAALLAGGAVVLPLDAPAQGWGVLAVVVGYAVALVVVCRGTAYAGLATFLALVSFFQLLPDWVLADLVGTLRFPDRGGPRLDDVIPLAMGAMWVAPLFVAVALAGGRPGRTALLAGLLFLGTEILAPGLGLWKPVGDTRRWLGVALYVVPAEAALGWATAVAFARWGRSALATRAAAALAVSTFYLGALVVAHFLIDVAGWRITT